MAKLFVFAGLAPDRFGIVSVASHASLDFRWRMAEGRCAVRRGDFQTAYHRLLPHLPCGEPGGSFSGMSTVAEIESAIERLKPNEVAQLAAWLEEYQQMIHASAEMFALYDQEEASSGSFRQGFA